MELYDFKEHIHRYAVWTAARAQRGFFASNNLINDAVKKCNLKKEVFDLPVDMKAYQFDDWHLTKTHELLSILKELKPGVNVKFGRAVKIMNIYLKTAIIIPNSDLENELVSNIHPPIDRILLSALIKENLLSKNLFKPWTILEAEDYNEIINEIKGKFKPLWKVEYLWNLEKNEE